MFADKSRVSAFLLSMTVILTTIMCLASVAEAHDLSDCDESERNREKVTQDSVRSTAVTFANVMRAQTSRLFAPTPTQVGLLETGPVNTAGTDHSGGMVTGLASGDAGSTFGAWISGTRSFLENTDDDPENGRNDFKGEAYMVMVGFDFPLTEKLIPGFAVGCEGADLDTYFNDGSLSTSGITFSPYAAYMITDNWILNAAYGYTPMNTETKRDKSLDYAVEGDYASRRDIFTADLTYQTLVDNWALSGFVGHMYSNELQDTNIETRNGRVWHTNHAKDIFVGQLQVGGRAGYLFEHVEPYVGLAYLYDYTMSVTEDPDRDEVETTVGLNMYAEDTLSVGAELRNSLFRKEFKNTTLMLNVRLDF